MNDIIYGNALLHNQRNVIDVKSKVQAICARPPIL
jgi:hypothetical protein